MTELSFGVGLQPREKVSEIVELTRLAEENGFEYAWIPDSHLYARDVYVTMTACAYKTSKIKLGTAVTNPLTRHPALTANAIGTLQEISNGRAILGVGVGDKVLLQLGATRASPKVCKEMVVSVRRLLAGQSVTSDGAIIMNDAKLPYNLKKKVPIYIAATGPEMLQLSGEVADGVLINVGLSKKCLAFARENIKIGAERAGRSIRDIDLVCWTFCSDTGNRKADQESLKPITSWFAVFAPNLLELAGIPLDNVPAIKKLYKDVLFPEAARKMSRFVTEEMVNKFSIAGAPGSGLMASISNSGMNQLSILPFHSKGKTIKRFARAVIHKTVAR